MQILPPCLSPPESETVSGRPRDTPVNHEGNHQIADTTEKLWRGEREAGFAFSLFVGGTVKELRIIGPLTCHIHTEPEFDFSLPKNLEPQISGNIEWSEASETAVVSCSLTGTLLQESSSLPVQAREQGCFLITEQNTRKHETRFHCKIHSSQDIKF